MGKKLEIIDWENKGNVVRFYLGKNGEQWGDDWDDVPYECNAGGVYGEYIKAYVDIPFPFDVELLFPDCGCLNSEFSKLDFIQRKVPFMIAVKEDFLWSQFALKSYYNLFRLNIHDDENVLYYYFGDEMEVVS
jgi:hypothetical protein